MEIAASENSAASMLCSVTLETLQPLTGLSGLVSKVQASFVSWVFGKDLSDGYFSPPGDVVFVFLCVLGARRK